MSNPLSLYQIFLRWLLLPLIVVLLVGSLMAYQFSLHAAMKVLDLGLYDNALDLSKQIQMSPRGLAINLPPAALQMLQENNDDQVIYAAWDHRGHVFSGNARLWRAQSSSAPGRPVFEDLNLDGETLRAVYTQGIIGDQRYSIAVAQTLHGRNRLSDGLFANIVMPEALLLLATIVIILLGIRRVLVPVYHLRYDIGQRSANDLRPLEERTAPTELRPIIHGINELLQDLALSFASHRRFIADAAHQLRTPLASLSSQLEVALEQPPPDIRPLFMGILATTRRTTHLANQLLSLARLEHTEQSMMECALVDLQQICREVAVDFVARAEQQQVELIFELTPLSVFGSPLMLRELLGNLLDNALRYTPEKGQVMIRLSGPTREHAGQLIIQDDGPGVPEAELSKLSIPFHRVPGDQTPGCGLGLAIVQEIVRLHAGQLRFNGPESVAGLRVEVTFYSQGKDSRVGAGFPIR